MGAVLVIAIFYTQTVAWRPLTLAVVILGALATLNLLHVRRLTPYLVLGAVLWFFIHESGIHATVAGVLLALAIPTRTAMNATEFSREARRLLDDFDRTETGEYVVLTNKGQQEAIDGLERVSEAVTAPLLRLEHALHGLSAYLAMPLFALSNAGVALGGSSTEVRVVVGIVLGLAVGKPLGIMAAARGAAALGLAAPPNQVSWGTLHGCAWLGGIGFTMSLFIATLAFEGTPLLDAAKIGVLSGSLIALVVAAIVLRVVRR